MRDAFQEAFRAVEKIWDYENRTIPDGVTIDDIQRAESAVDAVDITLLSAADSDMLALLQESVREACRIFEERERNADSGVDGTQEPVLDMDHELAVAEEEIDTADPEDEYGDALGREGLERYNQEVWDKLEEKKELQRKRTEEKKRTDRWLRRLRAKQETEREAKAKREAEAKAVEERNEAEKNRADERARIIARYQKKQRIYESKKEREDYRRETTRKHMAEREELRARAEDRIREQERKRQEANRERVREARAEKAPGHHSHGALSDEKVKNGRKQDQVLASMAAVGQIPEQRVFTERKVLDQDSSGSKSYETEKPDGSFHHENEEKREAGNPSMDEQNNVFYDPERQVAGSGHIQRNSKRQEENHSFDQFAECG